MEHARWFAGVGPHSAEFPHLTYRQVTIFFTVYVFFQVWNQINCRSLTPDESGFHRLFTNKYFLTIATIVAVGQVLIVTIGGPVFKVEPLGAGLLANLVTWALVIAFTATVLVFAEVARAMREPIKGFGLLSDFAIRKARGALGRERLTRHHPALAREALILEEYAHQFGRGVDAVLRRHGRDIAEMQYTQKRTADMAIDLYGLAACISRTTRAIERRGEEGARREIDLTNIFAATAERRLAQVVAEVGKNDDELRKNVATRAYADGGYPFDVV